ncbi:MAG: UDP-N-acetylglucosamine 2-epimerase (non-hydrolyzing) [Nitrosomonas sp.]|uniref:non-hydrolyzing UDP-N-acetylglucosamine 2-epimerase n=1 Tax=Nitrosomonas sp. TaxID=42353 RepID=UPI0025FA9CDF|nr:UDP-N-acetylglucosamine 2-epimerase (non-hydrolyzing) [Nitrosomonas sp.]MBY0473509.1 UDP-N-acetylglucosamine 2-epimerase (non-hydrolyzing) [Nitrosomonas sp.]
MKVGIVIGTRPEVMKNYAIVKALREANLDFVVLHTNQHQDPLLREVVFAEMGYVPDFIYPRSYSIGAAIDWVCEIIRTQQIDLILVNGDTAASIVGAVAAVYSDVGLAHVEAGLRAYDNRMYEERNRIMVDSAAHYLFTYTQHHADYLKRIPDLRGRIFNVGNTTVDLIHDFSAELVKPRLDTYAYITLHRKEFTDSRKRMIDVFTTLNSLVDEFDAMIFPIHPRTRDAMQNYGLSFDLLSRIMVIDPVDPFTSLSYEKFAALIITDSGCIQEEAYIFGVPCVTVRNNTERPETIKVGANVLTGFSPGVIQDKICSQKSFGHQQFPPVYGDIGVGERIVQALRKHFINWRNY